METLESTVQTGVQQVFDSQMVNLIQQTIANSMQQQLHGLAVSAKSQRETGTQQAQGSPSGKAHNRITDDGISGGDSSGVAANR